MQRSIRKLLSRILLCWIAINISRSDLPCRADEADAGKPSPTPAVESRAMAAASKTALKAKPAFQYQSKGIEVVAATADEPKVEAFGTASLQAAVKYLDDGAHHWVREKNCIACHSTGVYMAERPFLTNYFGKPSEEVLNNFITGIPEQVVGPQTRDGVPFFPQAAASIWRSLGLASWDRYVNDGKLSEHTDRSLKHMLQCMSDDGSYVPIRQVEIPYITTHYELSVQAARAVVTAPSWLERVDDPAVAARLEKLRNYLRKHEPLHDYELAMQLRLASLMPDLVNAAQREAGIAMLRKQQQPDGSWSTRRMAPLMQWHETMDPKVVQMIESEPDAASPGGDPYMTGFAIVLLREAGISADDPQIQNGIAWLKAHQRVTGRWWMKSLYRDTYHYITYISTTQALRALALCGELK